MWRLAEDTLGEADMDALADWLRTHPHLTQGEMVKMFESAWSDWVGSKESVMVSSGTTANFALVAMAARHIDRPVPRVGVSAVTWSTNVTPSLLLGHEVVVFDVDRRTLGIDTASAVAAMDAGMIDMLFVTHLLGFNALTPQLIAAADRNGVILIEDCCEAHGARFGSGKVGTLGRGGTFSFYFGHHMSTIEGGMIVTSDADFADELRLMRAHGLARESSRLSEYAAASPGVDERFLFVTPGLNFRSTELNAFLGMRQLETIDERIEHRNAMLDRFCAGAPPGLWADFDRRGASSFALPLIAEGASEAKAVRAVTEDLGIETRPVVAGNLLRQPFMEGAAFTVADGGTPVADHIHDHGLYVGNGHHVTDAMVDELVASLAQTLEEPD